MPDDIRVEIAEAIQSFKISEAELRAFLTGPGGPVFRDLERRAIRVQNSAKAHATERPGPRVRTNRLRGSITHRLGTDEKGPYADIGSAVSYAPYVELGHNIVRAGRVVGFAPPYPFLRPALEAGRAV